ncbi:peptidoglycan-binding protein [Shinella sp.]|uniref:peptidoglycan-binding protein n=1 Tax=Shinella sp. TaxID=1870904 RepID=UPI0028ACE417|nr:peptidoglycan-binding protein [Shinella sp.]
MDRTVPKGAALLLVFIYETETKTEPPACYNVIYGHNQDKLPKPLTSMTLAEVQKAQSTWTRRFKSSAAGAAQFMRATLKGLIEELNLSTSQKFGGDLQDRLGYHLLKRRGYEEFMARKISRAEFGKRLAMEWASFPVLKATKGAKLNVKRGQSYYAGDGLNKALVAPAVVEAVLDRVKGIKAAPLAPAADPGASNIFTDKTTVEIVQRRLYDLGYTEVGSRRADGSFDGKIGDMTKAAILAFRNDNALPIADVIDHDMLEALDKAPRRNLPRNDAPAVVVREQVPEVKANWRIKVGAAIGGAVSAAGALFDGIVSNLGLARGYLGDFADYVGDLPGWVKLGTLVLVAGGIYYVAHRGEAKGIEAFREGARR